jgi:outer membrane protein assembly factor BamB
LSTVSAAVPEALQSASESPGGLVVQLGCDSGELISSFAQDDAFLVQQLDTDADRVARAREAIRQSGLSGKVTAERFDGKHLPYVDELVNYVIAESLGDVSMEEVMRVLRPGGVLMLRDGDQGKMKVKPYPDEVDDWTHYLYDAQGTSVSDDRIAGHPKGLRWTGGPFWARSHEHTASMTAMVSARGRVFYVMDEGPTASIQLPPENVLTARDAYNGVVLWKRPLKKWHNPLYPLKSGPGWLPRRLVAVGDRVYLSPGVGQNLLCLDAATGEVVREYPDTAMTFELIVSDGIIFASIDPDHALPDYAQQHPNCWKERDRASKLFAWNRPTGNRRLKAIEADSGEVLWEQEKPVAPMTLSADDKRVCFYDGEAVIALDRRTGDSQWATPVLKRKTFLTGESGPRMILGREKVVFSPAGHIVALESKTGNKLWQVDKKPRSGHFSLEDFYVLGDKVWVLQRRNNGAFTTYDLETGEPLEEYVNPIKSFYIHQRCYPGRATTRFQLPPMMGVMVYDMENDAWFNNHWIRGGCVYGVMPANGMVYATPHACACYYQSKLNGFNAVSPQAQDAEAPPAEKRLVRGPAYGKPISQTSSGGDQWPTFRHDNRRSGYVHAKLTPSITPAWKKSFGTKLSQPTVADGKLFLSEIDEHTIHAFDAGSGKNLWQFIAGGRVDSPPTFYRGRVFFGCADGCIYALDADSGRLAWQFRAAPSDRKLVSFGQLESVWPLSGSILIENGTLYGVAGRSMFLDGGLRMIMLDPETGKLIAENVMDEAIPDKDRKLQDLIMGKHMPVAMPDILSSDGEHVYMKSQTFTMDGKRVRIRPQRPDTQYDREVHLFSPISFLDDTWHQRTYWILGRAAGEGWAEFQFPPKRVPCGRILCFDRRNAYAYGRDPELMCNTSVSEYRLFSAAKEPARKVGIPRLEGTWVEGRYSADEPLASNTVDWKQLSEKPAEQLSALKYHWLDEEPEIMARAMVLTDDLLLVAGPRDVADEKTFWGRSNEDEFQRKMAEQAAWLRGDFGAILQVISKSTGKELAEYDLPSLVRFDGMIAATDRLYMVTENGELICYRNK